MAPKYAPPTHPLAPLIIPNLPRPQSVLIIGATGGLGSALAAHYATLIPPSSIFVTCRASEKTDKFPEGVRIISGVDCTDPKVGERVVAGVLKGEVSEDYRMSAGAGGRGE